MLRRMRGRPPLLRRTTWLLLRRVGLAIGWLSGGTIGRGLLWLLSIWRLLLLLLRVNMLSIVGMVVLRRQSRLAGVLRLVWVLRLSVIGPLLLVLWVANWSMVWVLCRRVVARVLGAVWLLCLLRWLLRVAVRCGGLVVRSGTRLWVTSSASTSMSTTASSILIRRILGVAVRGRSRGRGGRWWAVVIRHVDAYFVVHDLGVLGRSLGRLLVCSFVEKLLDKIT